MIYTNPVWGYYIALFTIPAGLRRAWQKINIWNYTALVQEQVYTWVIILYRWWLLKEGTSRNVPIAGFEMILREDYKSQDEVEGLIIFPKYHFKPQDTRNILWCSRQQSRHLLYYMASPLPCPASAWTCRNLHSSVKNLFSGDFL